MNYQQQFLNIVDILRPYTDIWQREVIDVWRDGKIDEYYPAQLLSGLENLTEQELYQIDCKRNYSCLNDSKLRKLLTNFKAHEIVEDIESEWIKGVESLPSWAFNKVKGKKQYEILTIANFLSKLQNRNKLRFKHVVDIGGGVGHLSRILAHYFDLDMLSLDINQEFQDIGIKRLNKYPKPDGHRSVEFINHDFSIELESEKNAQIFCKDSFSLGLHTCGALAVKHIQVASDANTSGLLNFGCCYNKLDPSKDINISNFSRANNPLEFGRNSCTLATRGHSSMTFEEYKQKKKVKFYRYCLQFYIDSIYGTDNEVAAIGDAHKSLYAADFATYAINKCKENSIPINLDSDGFNNLLKDNESTLEMLFKCDIIRWQFGRLLELYILLDRVMMLNEKGKKARLMTFFDETQSPRNIGIWYHE